MAISTLRKSNVAKFLPIVSNDEVIRELLAPDLNEEEQDLTFEIFNAGNWNALWDVLDTWDGMVEDDQGVLKKINDVVTSILVTAFHSLTINISFTNDILNFISKETFESIKNAFKDQTRDVHIKLHEIIMNQIVVMRLFK